jgi:hypothetical protein
MITDLIIDPVDCNIPAAFAVGLMGAIEKLDDAWQMQVQVRSRWKPFLSSFFLFCFLLFSISQ